MSTHPGSHKRWTAGDLSGLDNQQGGNAKLLCSVLHYVSQVCGSGLKALHLGMQAIASGALA